MSDQFQTDVCRSHSVHGCWSAAGYIKFMDRRAALRGASLGGLNEPLE